MGTSEDGRLAFRRLGLVVVLELPLDPNWESDSVGMRRLGRADGWPAEERIEGRNDPRQPSVLRRRKEGTKNKDTTHLEHQSNPKALN